MKKVLLTGLMAVTALTPISSAIAAQPDHDGRGHREGRAVTRMNDRDDRREARQEHREDRQDWREGRREDRREWRQDQRDWRDARRDDHRERREERRDWRDDRREDRRDWRDARGDRLEHRHDGWRDGRDWRDGRSRVIIRDRWTDQRRWDPRWRHDHRYDWERYRYRHRHIYRMPRYYAPRGWDYGYSRFSIGIFLGAPLYARGYWIDDPWYYRLPPAYGYLRWVRYYDDALLVDIRDGYVVDVIYDFFD